MTPQAIHFQIEEKRFDPSLLPAKARKPRTPTFRQAVISYYRQAYAPLGGAVEVDFLDDTISVTWRAAEAEQNPMEGILGLLQAGRYADARPMLESLLTFQPDDPHILYNLGMVYSDEGRLDEARQLLQRATQVAPQHANAFVALGVAALRAKALDEAERALRQAVQLEPNNRFALRSLGTLLLMKGDAAAAVDALRQAVHQTSQDPLALLSLAQALIEANPATHSLEADDLLQQVLALSPYGEIAEKAQNARRHIAQQTFREGGRSALRMDAVMYCLEGLKKFQGLSQAKLAPILLEIATLGQKGLPVNDPAQKYQLRSLAGEFTALQLVCLLHVGIKKFDPSQGSSFDINQEYEAALAVYGDGGASPTP
ncbi:MAG: tetratricopeptide repeat protein [Chromatiaceae bacterium]|nr:tetratricopeptide repeat protein [Chromatiaceae bacterium]